MKNLSMIHMSEDSNVNSQVAAGSACCLVLLLVFWRHAHTQYPAYPPQQTGAGDTNADRDSRNKTHTSLSCLTLSYSSTSSALSSIRVGGRRSAMVLDLDLGLLNVVTPIHVGSIMHFSAPGQGVGLRNSNSRSNFLDFFLLFVASRAAAASL